jgi:hypothetical protein
MRKKMHVSKLPCLVSDLRSCFEKIECDGMIDPKVKERVMMIFNDLTKEVERLGKDLAALSVLASQVYASYGTPFPGQIAICRWDTPTCG